MLVRAQREVKITAAVPITRIRRVTPSPHALPIWPIATDCILFLLDQWTRLSAPTNRSQSLFGTPPFRSGGQYVSFKRNLWPAFRVEAPIITHQPVETESGLRWGILSDSGSWSESFVVGVRHLLTLLGCAGMSELCPC